MGRAQPGGTHGPPGRTCSPAHIPSIVRAPGPQWTPTPHRDLAVLSLTGSACTQGWRSLYGKSNGKSVAEVSGWSHLTQVTAGGYVSSMLARSALLFQSRSLWRLGTGGWDRHRPPARTPAWGSLCTFSLGDGGRSGLSPAARTERAQGGLICVGPGVTQGWACLVTTMPTLYSWYFSGISRTEARRLLLSPANAPGAFLIRPSESSQGDYSLSGMRVALVPLCPRRRPAQPNPPGTLLTLGWLLPRQCRPLAHAWPHIGPEPPLLLASCLLSPSLARSLIYSLTLLTC